MLLRGGAQILLTSAATRSTRVAAEVTRLSLLTPARDSAPTDVGDYDQVDQGLLTSATGLTHSALLNYLPLAVCGLNSEQSAPHVADVEIVGGHGRGHDDEPVVGVGA